MACVVFFFNLWRYGLFEPDEARYAEIAREMISGGGWIVPHLNYVAYVEKPPMLYWLCAGSMAIFGVNEFAARLPVALAAMSGLGATWAFTARTFGRLHAAVACAVLATIPLYAVMAQILTTDMVLTLFTTVASFAIFLQWRDQGRWWIVAYAAAGFAVMTKGPIGAAIPLGSIAAFMLWERDFAAGARRLRIAPGIALAVAIAAPWFVAISHKVPGFADFYFIGEHLRRALETDYSHTESWWFYIPIVAGGLAPWSLMIPLMTWRERAPNPARRFCIAMAALIVVGFSLASAKLIPYILPATPPLAILIADGIVSYAWPEPGARAANRPPDSRIMRECGPLLMILGLAAIGAATMAAHFRVPYVLAAQTPIFATGAIFLIGGIAASIFSAQRQPARTLAAITATMAGVLVAVTFARSAIEPARSYADLSRTIAAAASGTPIICYHRYVQSLPFYNRRRIILLGARTELDFGARRDPEMKKWFLIDDRQMLEAWDSPAPVVVVLDQADLERFRPRLGAFNVIASQGRKRAIVRPARNSSVHGTGLTHR
jgi:4-amino-4-deoxy-L-arabinose transferase-like glycosyltransferase